MPLGSQRPTGFSLIECLVALIVLSIGLLGVSKMVVNSLQFSDSALMQSQSVIMAYDLADKIRANEGNSSSYEIDLGEAVAQVPDCGANNCSGPQLAQADLADWKDSLSAALPLGDGQSVVAGNVATITVSWNDRGQARNFAIAITL
ncbi:MAG: type IV pilus modification protein PilV [Gammaproteobacteria bacterium]|nr:type IV pilus modification protein PilV [Gammaproteobacteria bacterium]